MERRRPVGRRRGRRAGRAGGGFFEFLNRHRSAIRSHLTRGREPHVADISVEAGRRWRMPEHQKDQYHAAASRGSVPRRCQPRISTTPLPAEDQYHAAASRGSVPRRCQPTTLVSSLSINGSVLVTVVLVLELVTL